MIMCMSDIICITNRKLCQEDFLTRIERIASCRVKGIVLREKDLDENEYKELAFKVTDICSRYGVKCILHSFVDVALILKADAIHLPLHILRQMTDEEKSHFSIIGASCHSAKDAKEAQTLGCTYITAGHVFETDCKKGLPGRGLDFLKNVCNAVSVPVYAIGGIDSENISQVRMSGASGACVMSSLMVSNNVSEFLKSMEEKDEV